MGYVIYSPQQEPNDSTHIFKKYKSRRGLKDGHLKLMQKYPNANLCIIEEDEFYRTIVVKVKRKNLLGGKEFEIDSHQADTFLCPSTETYHSS